MSSWLVANHSFRIAFKTALGGWSYSTKLLRAYKYPRTRTCQDLIHVRPKRAQARAHDHHPIVNKYAQSIFKSPWSPRPT